MSQVLVTVQ